MPGPAVFPAGYERPVPSVARFLMQKIVETFDAAGIELPTNRVITVGTVAVDEPLLAVMFGGISVGPPGNELNTPYRGDAPRTATMNVELWRRTPSLTPSGAIPSSASISASAESTMDDSWHLLEAGYRTDQMGVGIVANVAVLPPQGEMSGVSMAIEVTIP